MKTEYKLVLSDTTSIQDAGSVSDFDADPATLLLATIQLHAAQKIARQTRKPAWDHEYEIWVFMGREEQALLLARLTDSFAGLWTVYTTLKKRGIPRPDLLDEMLLMLTTQHNLGSRAGSRLAYLLMEAERYDEALELLGKTRIDYWNHVGVLIQTAELLSKLGRTAEARAKFEETERVIRQYHIEGDGIPPLSGLATVLTQHGETDWANRLLDETYQAVLGMNDLTIFSGYWLWEHIDDFAEAGRERESLALLERFEQLTAQLKGEDWIDASCGLIKSYLRLGQREKAEQRLANVEQTALTLKDERGKQYDDTLSSVEQALLDMGFTDRALEFARIIKEDTGDDFGYLTVIENLAETDQFDRAKALLPHLVDPRSQGAAQNSIALGLAKAGRGAEAEAMLVQPTVPETHRTGNDDFALALVSLMKTLTTAGHTDKVRAIFPKVFEAIEQISVGNSRHDQLFCELALVLAAHAFPDLVIQIVQKNYFDRQDQESPHYFDVGKVALALAEHGYIDEALNIIRRIRFWLESPNDYIQHSKAELLLETAVLLTTHGKSAKADEIFEEARALLNIAESSKPWRLNQLAGYFLRMNKLDAAKQLLDEVSQRHAEASSMTLTSVACRLTRLGQTERATELFSLARSSALQTKEALERADELLWLLEILFRAGRVEEARAILPDLQQAIKAIKGSQSQYYRAARWHDLTLLLIKAGEVEASRPLLRRIRRVIHKKPRRYRISKDVPDIVMALATAGRWDEALSLASVNYEIWNDWNLAERFSEFLRAMVSAGKRNEAKHLAKQVWDDVLNRPLHTNNQDRTGWTMRVETLGRAIARSGLIAEAIQVVNECDYHHAKKLIAFDLANILAEMGRFREALPLLDHIELDEYIQALCLWSPAFEKVEKGLAFSVLREVTRIVGWQRTDWHEIYELLAG